LSTRRICAHRRWQQIEASLIYENDDSSFVSGLFLELGPCFLVPTRALSFVTLAGAFGRFLAAPANLVQQTPSMAFTVCNAKSSLDHHSYSRSRPNIAAKAVRFRTFCQ
jgi:hypothetical protein